MLCLDSVLHTGLISLVSVNSFEICWWGSCVSAHAFSASVIVMAENSGVSFVPVETALNLIFRFYFAKISHAIII